MKKETKSKSAFISIIQNFVYVKKFDNNMKYKFKKAANKMTKKSDKDEHWPEYKNTRRALKNDFARAAEILDYRRRADWLRQTAVMVIDVQDEFACPMDGCGNKNTDLMAGRIEKRVSKMRAGGLQILAVGTQTREDSSCGGFYKFQPAQEDRFYFKRENSLFANRGVEKLLRHSRIKRLLVCGFNTTACVHGTVDDALTLGFKVGLLVDMVANGRLSLPKELSAITHMQRNGAELIRSTDVLAALRRKRGGEQKETARF